MRKHLGLKKLVEKLIDERMDSDRCEIVLGDGSRVRITFEQVLRGCVDAMNGNRTYEEYVIGHAANASGRAERLVALYRACRKHN